MYICAMERQRFKKKPNLDLIFGIRAVMEAIEAGKEFDKIFIKKGLAGGLANELITLLKKNQVPFQYVPIEKLNRLSRKNHQGVIGLISPIVYQDIEMILPQIFESGETPLIVVLDSVTDVRNFGAIARSAECAGAHAIVIPSKGGVSVTADAIKTSAGALHKLPVCRVPNLHITLKFLKESGLSLLAATEKADSPYYNADWSGPSALVMGSEDTGISNENLKLCDQLVQIPMAGTISSLNVSVAAGILIFEALKQRTSNSD